MNNTNKNIPYIEPDAAMKAAMGICHDLHEGYIPGCGRCLSLADTLAARKYIAEMIRQEFPVKITE